MEQDRNSPEEDITVPLILSVDEMIEQSTGHINLIQILQIFLVILPPFFDNQQTFISVFAHAQPTWHCTSINTSCTSKSNRCDLSRTEWAWDSGNVHTSIISEWDLECASTFISGLPGTSYFVGCLLGGLVLATLGDSSLGRKNLLCISSLVMSLAALASGLSPNLWVYSLFRFFCGVGRASVGTCVLVLLAEKVAIRWRPQGFFMENSVLLDLNSRNYMHYTSPRWLFMQGREKDAMEVLRGLGAVSQISSNLRNIDTEPMVPNTSHFISFKIILSSGWAVKRLLALMLLAFGIGLMYYGMFLGVGDLGFDIYLTLVFHALLSLCSYALTFLWWIQHCNRKTSLLGFCIISGVSCLAFSLLGKGNSILLITLELVSLFCACMAFNLVLMYMLELFPTCVRNSTSSLVRQSMTLGSVFDPMLILLGRDNMVYSYGVFGLGILLGGVSVLCLPETKGMTLCDTMEEQEFDSENQLIS